MNTRLGIIVVLLVVIVTLSAHLTWKHSRDSTIQPTDFITCVEAGNPVMESYPRQCRDRSGVVYVEEIGTKILSNEVEPRLTEAAARALASESSICGEKGMVGTFEAYNANSQTWWYTLEADKNGCNPACVVHDDSSETEINWRCTGL